MVGEFTKKLVTRMDGAPNESMGREKRENQKKRGKKANLNYTGEWNGTKTIWIFEYTSNIKI